MLSALITPGFLPPRAELLVNLGVLGVLVVRLLEVHHQDTKNAKNTKPIGCGLWPRWVSVLSDKNGA